MKQRDGRFTGAGSLSIFFQYWEPESDPHGVILIAHGAAEHIGRYQRFAEFFTGHGYVVAGLDHPGHGQSEGTRVYVDSFEDFLQSLRKMQQQVEGDFPGLPLFLLGHSLGGLISTSYLLRHQDEFAGCILSGPAIMTELQPGFLQTLLIRMFSALLPRTGVLQLDSTGVSRDPLEVERYRNDPLVYGGKMTARLVSELFKVMQGVQREASTISLPLLLLHGGADPMTTPEGSRFLHDNASSQDKTLHIYPGLYHEIFNEPEHESIFAEVLGWCNERTAGPAVS